MRWHPLFIKWCIYLRHLSGSAYEMLQKSGCVKLPLQKTLHDYIYYTSINIGFSDAVDEQLLRMADMSKEMNKYMGLVLDEVHIRADLVYDKHVGSLLGFVNLGEVNNHLMKFEGKIVGEEEELQQLANSMVLFMVVFFLIANKNFLHFHHKYLPKLFKLIFIFRRPTLYILCKLLGIYCNG